jgi:type I restriction-modification system DNA methylase subunit
MRHKVAILVDQFAQNEAYYLSTGYQESEVRTDFIDKFWIALGWDVRHKFQTNPREQEVKVEKNPDANASNRKADYAFYFAPEYRSPVFLVEAKKPSRKLADNDTYFQIVRYGRGAGTPVSILTDFEEFHIIDCRYEPSMTKSFPSAQIHVFTYKDYLDKEKFGYIYWLFSHEAVEQGKLKAFIKEMPKARGKGTAKLTADELVPPDEKFLKKLEEYRLMLAKAFKKADESLTAEELTEATQKVIDRLVFIRFLEDKNIESDYIVDQIAAKKGSAWKSFIQWSKELDVKYNGIVFKPHHIDSNAFTPPADDVFQKVCDDISHRNSKTLLSYLPVEILGSIYEQFLGKVITATAKRADIEEKPEVRKAGGVYYTPQYIVEYIVKNTVGKILKGSGKDGVIARSGFSPTKQSKNPTTADTAETFENAVPDLTKEGSPSAPGNDNAGVGLTPSEVSKLRFADIACGSGSFLIAVYDAVLRHVEAYYNAHPAEARKAKCIEIDKDIFVLSLAQKRQILLDNIYGVDIDNQAVEVAQLSLFLKLLESESGSLNGQLTFERTKILPDLSKNIVCGNSLVEYDIEDLFKLSPEDEKRIKPFDFRSSFKEIMNKGGFDAIVGNPPYVFGGTFGITDRDKDYFKHKYTSGVGKINLFAIFIERALRLSRPTGHIAYIVPNTLLRVTSYNPLRKWLIENNTIEEIADVGVGVFVGAITSSVIIIASSATPNDNLCTIKFGINGVPTRVKQSSFVVGGYILNINADDRKTSLLNRLRSDSIKLGEICKELIFGVVITKNFSEVVKTEPITGWKPFLEGRDIGRYHIDFKGKYLNYDRKLLHRPRSLEIFEAPEKIIIQRITGGNQPLKATLDVSKYFNKESLNNIILKDGISYNSRFVLALINSKVLNWFYMMQFTNESTLTVNLSKEYLSQLPVCAIDFTNKEQKQMHDGLVALVDQIMETKKRLTGARTESEKTQIERKCEYLDNEIDNLVYQLYGLSAEEIKIVEGL